jgi:hypothetical protein
MFVSGTGGGLGDERRREKLNKGRSIPIVWARDSDKEGNDGEKERELEMESCLNLTTSVDNNAVRCLK